MPEHKNETAMHIQKAQNAWKNMSSRQRALAQPEGRKRAKPGSKGEGEYFRIIVRPKEEFTSFRYHDVGDKGHIQRLTGRRGSGSWSTQAWLISKEDAHVDGSKLVPDTDDAKKIVRALSSVPSHVKGDIFKAKDRRNVAEKDKPTVAQQRARTGNIRKAQKSRQV